MSNPSGISLRHVQEQAGLVVDRRARSARDGARRLVDHGYLLDHLLVVERDHELVGLGRPVVAVGTPRFGTPLSTRVKLSSSSYWFSSSR